MHFDLTDDQRALVAGVRELCHGRFAIEKVQALEGDGFDPGGWAELAGAGVFSLRVPESQGGVGLGMSEAALVFAELGRVLVPGPLIGTFLGNGLVDGDAVGVVVPGQTPTLLAHPDVVGPVIVVTDDELRVVARDDLTLRPVEQPLDPLTPLATVEEIPAGELVGDAEDVQRFQLEGRVLGAALLLGIAEAVTERSTAYAKEREQFGRAIGGFQAVKHLLADMVVRTEVARAAVYAAAVHLDDPSAGDASAAVSTAKLLAGQNALANAKAAIQVHGGMGFTWEVPIHLYLKRAAFLDIAFGSVDHHAEVLATTL
jgi:alkylation response protein AidB-like acyl-CoA dehydrogenase